jgi:hypothetical protein
LSAVAVRAQVVKCDDDVNPISDKKALVVVRPVSTALNEPRKTSEIKFVRNRMFYSRPALNSSGAVRLGLRHIRKSSSGASIVLEF